MIRGNVGCPCPRRPGWPRVSEPEQGSVDVSRSPRWGPGFFLLARVAGPLSISMVSGKLYQVESQDVVPVVTASTESMMSRMSGVRFSPR